jgi:alkyldihydroxyacetonephosphate synthase
MVASVASLNSDEIVSGLKDIVGEPNVCTDKKELREASVDRFKKYTAVHDIFDGPIPAVIVNACNTQQIADVLAFANANRINVVPRTGRTGTEGGLETVVEDTIVLDGSNMAEIISIDAVNMQATTQCGVPLQVFEDALRQRGLTTGHSPQSKPLAQMGGLTATRSIGQLSTLYGGIEDMVIGLEVVFADGTISRIKSVPRRAAGPDIRHIAIGNEGALCFITEVTVKIFKFTPENDQFRGYLVDDMDTGLTVLREVVTNGFRPSVCRVYSEEDANQHFSHFSKNKCVLVFVSEGPKGIVDATIAEIERVVGQQVHETVAPALIQAWFGNLNWGLDKIKAEQDAMVKDHQLGYTTEVSANWSEVGKVYDAVMNRVRTEYPHVGDLTMLGGHSSHSYQTGANMYFVYDYKINCEPREEIEKYHIPLNTIIVEEALRFGGSMVHHHGIGKYRTQWTAQEHGSAYYMLTKLKEAFDPQGIMNKGTIFNLEP